MIRILHILDSLDYGGVENFVVNMYRNINRENIQFDFLIFKENNCYEEEVRKLGGEIYKYTIIGSNKFIRALKSIKIIRHTIIEGNYQIIHCHNCSLVGILKGTISAKFCSDVKAIIAHSHNTGIFKNTLFNKEIRLILKELIGWSSDYYFACSKDAALSKFPKRKVLDENKYFKIIHNAIDIEKFKYNEVKRKNLRKKLNLEGQFVIGHVGRFEYQKNHTFLIKIFRDVIKNKENSKLILVGGGSLEKEIRKEVINFQIEDKVVFLGSRKDVADIYQCMDVFVFPSYFEGLGIVLIEAQASGLKCIISDKIPDEAKITNNVEVVKLNNDSATWASKIIEIELPSTRISYLDDIKSKGYDLSEEAQKLEEFYKVILQ